MTERVGMPHASVVESMGVCVFCGLPASGPGPCEKRPSRYLSVGNETYDSEGGGAGTYRDRSSAYPSDHIGFGDCGCDVCCPEPGPSPVARHQVSAAKPENDGGDFKSGASVDGRLLRAIDAADKASTSMTAYGRVNDKWMRGFLATLAAEGLAIVEAEWVLERADADDRADLSYDRETISGG